MIRENIETIRGRITAACTTARRNPDEITVLAVSKTFSFDAVAEAVAAGIVDVGENYVQELLNKKAQLEAAPVRWHFIGHLQTNKVKYIAGWIHLVHAVDSIGLASELDKRAKQTGRVIDVLLEVNTTGEQTKFGLRPEATTGFVQSLAALQNIRIAGLMTMGPFLPDPEGSRPMFRRLRVLRDEVAALKQPNVTMRHLSMGMTGDFEVAIEEGATIIRLGTAIFGKRTRKA
ncbi:MAG: YggS family pyridoxal phosphate-dependent enzyme [Bacteroidetes bacterium]|nr:YggS family pyridoxal phosphate-dependent enzyme [Bacteroidota bacterium]MCW5895778.1 YggS family pyridoxal phosphate-dependent enzyme [Bacteroidota bacterium]